MRAQPVRHRALDGEVGPGRAARRRAARRRGRSARSGLTGALVAGVALLALGLGGVTPATLFEAPSVDVATAADARPLVLERPRQDDPEPSVEPSPEPSAAPAAEPEPSAGPVEPPAPSMPTGPVIEVAKGGSIADAAAKAKPGDTVLIPGGTYSEGLDVPSDGAPGKPITYQAVPGEKVTLTGGEGISLDGRKHIRLFGIGTQGASRHGVKADGAEDIVLRDCEVADSQDGGIVFLQSSGIKVQRCEVHGNNARGTEASHEAISFDHSNDFEVSWSTVRDNGEEGIDAKYESFDGKFFANTVTGNRGPNIYVDSARDVEVFNNIVSDTTHESKPGIMIAVEDLSETRRVENVKVYNNVVRGNAGGGIGFWTESSGAFSGIDIVNNTVVDNAGGDLKTGGGSFSGTNLLRNNIFGSAPGETGEFTSSNNLTGSVSGLLDTALKLVKGSKAVGAGSPDGAPTFDITGAKRAGRIDAGAYQLR